MQVIIYKQDNDTLAVIYPTQEAIDLYGIEAIALKDVPSGKPFKIIDSSELPADRSTRDAWEADFSDPDGYGIGAEAWFLEQEQKAIQEALEKAQEALEDVANTEGTPIEENPAEAVLEPSEPILEGGSV